MADRPIEHPLMRRLLLLGLVAACGSPGPRPLAYDGETCAHCRMTLTDRRFGGELVLRTGRVIPFDDPGCLITYLAHESGLADRVESLWVSDFLPPHELLEARQAIFLASDSIRSPMDFRLAALPPGPRADSVRAALGGELLSWDRARTLVESRSPLP
jgi:copper chaperone NosL